MLQQMLGVHVQYWKLLMGSKEQPETLSRKKLFVIGRDTVTDIGDTRKVYPTHPIDLRDGIRRRGDVMKVEVTGVGAIVRRGAVERPMDVPRARRAGHWLARTVIAVSVVDVDVADADTRGGG